MAKRKFTIRSIARRYGLTKAEASSAYRSERARTQI